MSNGYDLSGAVFPARAGMSRTRPFVACLLEGVPRASGDEPQTVILYDDALGCSPRERG